MIICAASKYYACAYAQSMMNRSTFALTRRCKADHARLILAAQALYGPGDRGAGALAELSERSSAFLRDRAASLAVGYWELE